MPDNPNAPGAEISLKALKWWKNEWQGDSFMAIGMQDPILGPTVMNAMKKCINGCPPPLEIDEAGHFVQEWGGIVAEKALENFGI